MHSNNSVGAIRDEVERVSYQWGLLKDSIQIRAALAEYRAELVAVVIEATFNCQLVDELIDDG